MKLRSVGVVLIRADGQMDMTKLIVASCIRTPLMMYKFL
jgi:hypothetical protein